MDTAAAVLLVPESGGLEQQAGALQRFVEVQIQYIVLIIVRPETSNNSESKVSAGVPV